MSIYRNIHMDKLYQNTFTQFVTDLGKVFPEKKEILDQLLSSQTPYSLTHVQEFLGSVKPFYVEIANKDSAIFYNNSSLTFYPNLNFSELWTLGISDNTKNNIWSYLHTLILSSFAIISKSSDISMLIRKMNKVIKSQPEDNSDSTTNQAKAIIQIASTLKKDKKHNTTNTTTESDSAPSTSDDNSLFDLDNLPDLSDDSDNENDKGVAKKDKDSNGDDDDLDFDPTELFEGTKIGELAKEIAEEMDIKSLGLGDLENSDEPENIQDAFSKILGNDPSKLMNTVQNIGSKVQEKISNSGLTQEEMVKEAQGMMENMHETPMFKELFKNNEMGAMFQQMSQMMSQVQRQSQPSGSASQSNSSDSASVPDMSNMPNPMDLAKQMMANNPYLQQQQQQQQQQGGGSRSNATRERLQKKLEQRKKQNQK